MSIQGEEEEMLGDYRYPSAQLDKRMDWKCNTVEGRKLRSFLLWWRV